jgi:predicted NBD/HSP70 family sugar kinase
LTGGTHIERRFQKEHNRKLILRHILNTPVSRIQLAALTGLTRAGTGVIVDSLIKDGFVTEEIVKRPGKGRLPRALSIRDDALFAVGINITRSGGAVGICGLNTNIVTQRSVPLVVLSSSRKGLEILCRAVKALLVSARIPREKIIGIGVTSPGPVDSSRGIILTPPDFALWENCPIKEILESQLDMPVYLENNAIARTIEEQYYGLGKGCENFVCLVVNNGIGGGIVIRNEMVKGEGGFGSELGHLTINIQGERCYCGNIGCLELYANPKNFVAEALREGHPVSGWDEIALQASNGDPFFTEMVERMAFYLACECTNLINLFEPRRIILSGELNTHDDLLIKAIQARVDQSRINRKVRPVEILASRLSRSHGVMAAATLLFTRYLASPIQR